MIRPPFSSRPFLRQKAKIGRDGGRNCSARKLWELEEDFGQRQPVDDASECSTVQDGLPCSQTGGLATTLTACIKTAPPAAIS
jgi:hypothetical protein